MPSGHVNSDILSGIYSEILSMGTAGPQPPQWVKACQGRRAENLEILTCRAKTLPPTFESLDFTNICYPLL